MSIGTLRRARFTKLRCSSRFHTVAHTLISPTPEYLETHLSKFPPPPSSKSIYLLSTTLPNLPSLLSTLQSKLPKSIGSFQISPPTSPPTLSLATFTPSSSSSSMTSPSESETTKSNRINQNEDSDEVNDNSKDRHEIGEEIHIFRSEMSGRLPAEVGKWQRRPPSLEDLKGSMQGELEMVKAQGGWSNLWKSDIGHYGLVPELDNIR